MLDGMTEDVSLTLFYSRFPRRLRHLGDECSSTSKSKVNNSPKGQMFLEKAKLLSWGKNIESKKVNTMVKSLNNHVTDYVKRHSLEMNLLKN